MSPIFRTGFYSAKTSTTTTIQEIGFQGTTNLKTEKRITFYIQILSSFNCFVAASAHPRLAAGLAGLG